MSMCDVKTPSLTRLGLDHEEDNHYGRSEKRDRLVSVCLDQSGALNKKIIHVYVH